MNNWPMPGNSLPLYDGRDLLYNTIYDAFAVSGLYLFHALVFRSLLWENTVSHIAVFFLTAIITAAVVEYAAAHLLHAWNYLPSMPTVAGIGLLPLLQFAFTGVASIFAAERLSSHKAA